MSRKNILITENEKEENKNGVKKPAFLYNNKKERKNIVDYIFNDLKITRTKGNKNLLDKDEEMELFKKYRKKGDKAAFDKLVVSNLRFVIYMAKHFYIGLKSQSSCKNVYLDDLIQAGNIGLIRAVENYVPKKGCRFLSYAQHVIKSELIHYIKYENRFFGANSVYGVPDSKVKQMNKYIEEFLQENQRDPDDEELQDFYRGDDVMADFSANVGYYRHLTDGTVSLDMNVQELSRREDKLTDKIRGGISELFASDDEETCIKDLLVDIEGESKEPMEMESLAYDIDRVLHQLDEKKRKILEMWFGLNGYKPHDIEEIAYKFGITRSAISQHKLKAIEIIRDELTEIFKKYIG